MKISDAGRMGCVSGAYHCVSGDCVSGGVSCRYHVMYHMYHIAYRTYQRLCIERVSAHVVILRVVCISIVSTNIALLYQYAMHCAIYCDTRVDTRRYVEIAH